MSNLDDPIIPTHEQVMDGYEALSVRQYACIKMGVAATGCAELDAIIERGIKQRLAGLMMQAMLSDPNLNATSKECATCSIINADEVLKQLKGDA